MTVMTVLALLVFLVVGILATSILLRCISEAGDLIWMAVIKPKVVTPVAAVAAVALSALTLLVGLPASLVILLTFLLTPVVARPASDWLARLLDKQTTLPLKGAFFAVERHRQRSEYQAPATGRE